MRIFALALLVLNLFLAFQLSRMGAARGELLHQKAALAQDAAAVEAGRAEQIRLRTLLGAYRERSEAGASPGALGIAALRDELLAAEQGLELDRLSLEFRPESDLVAGMPGSRVQANLRGSFAELYEYLARIEARRLPLAPVELTFREQGGGDVSLTLRWVAAWPPRESSPALASLSAAEVERLSRWVGRKIPAVGDELFAKGPAASRASVPPRREAPPPPPEFPKPEDPEPLLPRWPDLVGFVLARPELEPDVGRRVLAALRYGGELHLAEVGDEIGGFRVEAIDGRESVTLRDSSTAERVVLRLY